MTTALSDMRIVTVSTLQVFILLSILYNRHSPATLCKSFRAHGRSDADPRTYIDEPGESPEKDDRSMSQLIEELKSDHVTLKQTLKQAADFTRPATERVMILHQAKTALLATSRRRIGHSIPPSDVSRKLIRL